MVFLANNNLVLFSTTFGFTAAFNMAELTAYKSGATIGLYTSGAQQGAVYRSGPAIEKLFEVSADL